MVTFPGSQATGSRKWCVHMSWSTPGLEPGALESLPKVLVQTGWPFTVKHCELVSEGLMACDAVAGISPELENV